ncbi:hypothetical protein BKA70DRAFT_1526543 [Coprinopsis sp. MPI-PUGE-AT-0042]|nr:hypothetical protein BKA70DRAFT_1526543 [Coprinopsis sp. MPI-PUGE-AT-0042]
MALPLHGNLDKQSLQSVSVGKQSPQAPDATLELCMRLVQKPTYLWKRESGSVRHPSLPFILSASQTSSYFKISISFSIQNCAPTVRQSPRGMPIDHCVTMEEIEDADSSGYQKRSQANEYCDVFLLEEVTQNRETEENKEQDEISCRELEDRAYQSKAGKQGPSGNREDREDGVKRRQEEAQREVKENAQRSKGEDEEEKEAQERFERFKRQQEAMYEQLRKQQEDLKAKEDDKRRRIDEERVRFAQQEEFRQREEEIRRCRQEESRQEEEEIRRRRQDSTEGAYLNSKPNTPYGTSSTPRPPPSSKSPPQRAASDNHASNGEIPAWASWGSAGTRSSTKPAPASGAPMGTSTRVSPSKPRAGPMGSGAFKSSTPYPTSQTPCPTSQTPHPTSHTPYPTRKHYEALKLQQEAKEKEAVTQKKELEILRKERELEEREMQLQKQEEELKRLQELRQLEDQLKAQEQETKRLSEELEQKKKALERQDQELKEKPYWDRPSVFRSIAEEFQSPEELGSTIEGLSSSKEDLSPVEAAPVEPAADAENDWQPEKNAKGKKGKKTKTKKGHESGHADRERQEREEREREDREHEERERAARHRRRREDEARKGAERIAAEEEVKREKLRRLEEERSARMKKLEEDRRRAKMLEEERERQEEIERMTRLEREKGDQEEQRRPETEKRFHRARTEEQEQRRKQEERERLEKEEARRKQEETVSQAKEDAKRNKKEEEDKEAQERFERFKRQQEAMFEQLRKQQEDMKAKEDEKRRRIDEERVRFAQQEEFRQREEEVRRRRQDGTEGANLNSNPNAPYGTSSAPRPPPWVNWGSAVVWPSSNASAAPPVADSTRHSTTSITTSTTTASWAVWTPPVMSTLPPAESSKAPSPKAARKRSASSMLPPQVINPSCAPAKSPNCGGLAVEQERLLPQLPTEGLNAPDGCPCPSLDQYQSGHKEGGDGVLSQQNVGVVSCSPVDLEHLRLEIRCAMTVKLHEEWLKMDLQLEREVCKRRTSWMKQKERQGKDDDSQVYMNSVDAVEDSLRQEHAKAVEKLRADMECGVREEVERQAKGIYFPERDHLRAAESHQPNEVEVRSRDHTSLDQNSNDFCDPEERGDNREAKAIEQVPRYPASNLEEPCTNLSERVPEPIPLETTGQQVVASQTAEHIPQSENQFSLASPPPESNDSLGHSSAKPEEERVCPPLLSNTSDDGELTSKLRPPSNAPAELGLDPKSLGILDIPPPSSFHNSQSTQPTTGTTDAAQEMHSSQVSVASLKPGGKANFRESDNVQVHGGSFVAASTVVTNNYYVTHFHGTPSPPPRSSNRGSTRAYSIHL